MNSILDPITPQQHNRLLKLHSLIRVNGMSSMTHSEVEEFATLLAKSLRGKGDVPIDEVSTKVPTAP